VITEAYNAGYQLIRLEVELPEGYKVNDTAPSVFEWEAQGGVPELPPHHPIGG